MTTTTTLEGNVAQITLEGRLDLHNTPELRALLHEISDQGAKYYFMVMDRLEFIDSSGLSALVSGLKLARKAGGELVLVAPGPTVTKLLDLTMLNKVIPVEETLAGARSHVS
ncbi:STAS domain-containing protein [Deinococcus aquiradiocola]|uniref:Anti-sigma factor antagonist n=1 Tax=Deinococcus aquiradiocola TaxID=393059 RepID=A0A917PBU4_9DEIO|nr:STAS domain-containing protein [Deinococcus aquiradiocola]GGJ70282.1 anti-sigma factor antagonist [Deinococcus aquiradiocola]